MAKVLHILHISPQNKQIIKTNKETGETQNRIQKVKMDLTVLQINNHTEKDEEEKN